MPVSETVANALGAETRRTKKLDPAVAGPREAQTPHVGTVMAVIPETRPYDPREDLYRCWDTMQQRARQQSREPRRGLGFDGDNSRQGGHEDRNLLALPSDPVARRAEVMKRSLEYYTGTKWVTSTSASGPSLEVEDARKDPAVVARVDGGPLQRRAEEPQRDTEESEVTETPLMQFPPRCLYLHDLVVCRQPRLYEAGHQPTRYLVDMALTVRRALGNTGAGLSVITTKLLELLPADA